VVPATRSSAPAVLSLVLLLSLGTSDLAAQDSAAPGPFVAVAQLSPGGPAVYLGSGLLLTAAHVVKTDVETTAAISGMRLPVTIVKQGVFDEIDLSLMRVDQRKLTPAAATSVD